MNKDKAIQLLERLQDPEPYEPMLTKDAYDAIQMAIDALSADGDTISRKAAIDALGELATFTDECSEHTWMYTDDVYKTIKQLPPIQPDNGLQKLADEIASFKRCVKSENSDYLTGYLCALSVVEGMIADMREVTT